MNIPYVDTEYYERYSSMLPLKLLACAIFSGGARRQAFLNRQRDYIRLQSNPELRRLHGRIMSVIAEAANDWDAYDYGEGYLYQGLAELGITGLRDTRARTHAYGLQELASGRTVLDIGCNSGFVSLSAAKAAKQVVGVEVNPFLVRIAELGAGHLGLTNTAFRAMAFEDFQPTETFDVILSLANHSTYDGKTRQTTEMYLEKCHRLLTPGGTFLFESHAPKFEEKKLLPVISMIDEMFDVQTKSVLDSGTYLDVGRTVIVSRKRQ